MKTGMYVCDSCHTVNKFTVTEYINAEKNPDLKKKLVEGKLFLQNCSKCGHENIVVSSMLYEDPEKHLLIEMVPKGENKEEERLEKTYLNDAVLENLGTYKKRTVHEPNELLEKIAISDADLDDRVIEIMKLSAAVSILDHQNITVSDMYFSPSETDMEFDVLVNNEFYGTIPFRKDLYREIQNSYMPLLNSHEASASLIDMDWAMEVIRSKRGMRA